MSRASISLELASRLARVGLANVTRPYPHKLDHLLSAPGEIPAPRVLHPAFYGSYDWHSAVHMHWLLARLLRLWPSADFSAEVAAVLDAHLTPRAIEAELAYLRSDAGRTFERPYGWAWLLKLQAELGGTRWANSLLPLAAEIGGRFGEFVQSAPYPIRAGSHGNTAFACLLALDYARKAPDAALAAAISSSARRWYAADRMAPLAYEPSLDDFLSPALVEACLMREVLTRTEFDAWMGGFLPQGATALQPPQVADRSDPKQAHLDGLSLSRAWCLRRLGFHRQAQHHLDAGLPHVTGGDYAGEHWLASFALLALSEGAPTSP